MYIPSNKLLDYRGSQQVSRMLPIHVKSRYICMDIWQRTYSAPGSEQCSFHTSLHSKGGRMTGKNASDHLARLLYSMNLFFY